MLSYLHFSHSCTYLHLVTHLLIHIFIGAGLYKHYLESSVLCGTTFYVVVL